MYYRFYLCFLTMGVVLGCSSGLKKEAFHSLDWIEQTSQACPANHLCAVGNGENYAMAESSARESLGKIFEIHLVSKTRTFSDLSKVELEQDTYELTEEILDGVRILRRGEKKGQFFALAVLNKSKSARQIRGKIKSIDERLLAYYNSDDKKKWEQALKQFEKRSRLNHRYRFLTGLDRPSPVGYRKIHQKIDQADHSIRKKRQKNVVLLQVAGPSSAQKIEQALIRKLLLLNYRVVLDSKLSHTFVLKVVSDIRQEHFKVKGFEAYRLNLTFTGKTHGGKRVGSFNLSTLGIGRSQGHAETLGLKNILIDLESKLDHLWRDRWQRANGQS